MPRRTRFNRMYKRILYSLILICVTGALHAIHPDAPTGYRWVVNERFTDEFNGTSLNTDRWHDHHPKWNGRPPAKFMPSAVSVKNGQLRIRNGVLDRPDHNHKIAGGAVVSKSTEAHFGYYEVRMKASQIPMSSTFWFSNDGARVGDKWISQELDVQETIGGAKKNPEWRRTMHSNTHVWAREDGKRVVKSKPGLSNISPETGEAFHTYGVWWVDANTMHFYHDDEFQFTLQPDTSYSDKPFARPMHLNLVTETYDWEPPPTVQELNDDTINTTYYDWVRGYRLVKAPNTAETAPPFEPTWDSLKRYEAPEWFRDAKFGIYAHWGVYSATGGSRNTDWYSRNMYDPQHRNYADHLRNHGPVDEFGYKDLVPLFTGEKFNADEWVDLYVQSGARFAGPVAEHSDGFAMWDTELTPWNAKEMGPKRDVVREMEIAVRKRGLKFVTSLHHHWRWGWYPTWDSMTDCANPKYASLYGPKLPATAWGTQSPLEKKVNVMRPAPSPNAAFNDDWLARVKEVVTGYQPDLLWFDNRMEIIDETKRREMVALYYNEAAKWNRDVVLTFKRPDLVEGSATIDLERSRMPDIFPEPWLTDSSISSSSWSYANDLEYYSTDRLIHDLIDIVSKNGCLLLNVAPAPDGTIPATQKERLLEIGQWLKTNGEAIYSTRPWTVFGEGPTSTPEGHLADLRFEGFTAQDIRFTRSKDGSAVYAILLGWPKDGYANIKSLGNQAGQINSVHLLATDQPLPFKQSAEGLRVELSDKPPGTHAFVPKLTSPNRSAQ